MCESRDLKGTRQVASRSDSNAEQTQLAAIGTPIACQIHLIKALASHQSPQNFVFHGVKAIQLPILSVALASELSFKLSSGSAARGMYTQCVRLTKHQVK